MKTMRMHLFTLFASVLICGASLTIIGTAQENQKQKAGTTVDTWRQSLPSDIEAQSEAEETPGVSTPRPSDDETQKTLLSLERMWMDALRAGDADTLSQIVSGDFTFANPRQIDVKDRSKYLDYALRELKLTSYEFDQPTIRVFGRTAIVSGLVKQKAIVKGEDRAGAYLVTDVWISRGGNWRVVSRHESPLQERRQ
jgi:ketosteroid isomerase-like protein